MTLFSEVTANLHSCIQIKKISNKNISNNQFANRGLADNIIGPLRGTAKFTKSITNKEKIMKPNITNTPGVNFSSK